MALLLLSGLPAAATEHEVGLYGPVLTGCFEAAADVSARADCVGLMSTECMDRQEGGHSTLGMTYCLNAEASVWDGFLNAEYRAAQDWVKAADADEAAYFPAFAVRAEKLLAAQRAWIAFRDAECALEYARWGSGSMRNIAHADCVMRMTAERTIQLGRMREVR